LVSEKSNSVTDQPARLEKQFTASASLGQKSPQRHFAAESTSAGLQWLSAAHEHDHWTEPGMLDNGFDVWATACVLARLGELPAACISHSLRQQIECSLNWLEHARVAGQGWSGNSSASPDAFTTSWAIIALRSHRRAVPRSSLDLLLRCRQANGGFSPYPQGAPADGPYNVSSPEITVTALRALSMCDSAAEAFVSSHLRGDVSLAGMARTARLYLCSEVLEWESGLGTRSFLSKISQSVAPLGVERAYEQALVLRSLLRLRNQRAWAVGAALRETQLADGSWPAGPVHGLLGQSAQTPVSLCCADFRTITTVTAVSALVMSESQPGLYFGSDLPLPRRYPQC
jgi:hypothetical protein